MSELTKEQKDVYLDRYQTFDDLASALFEAEQERESLRVRCVAAETALTRTVYGVCSGNQYAHTYRVHWLAAEEADAQRFADQFPDEDYWVEKFALYEWSRP